MYQMSARKSVSQHFLEYSSSTAVLWVLKLVKARHGLCTLIDDVDDLVNAKELSTGLYFGRNASESTELKASKFPL